MSAPGWNVGERIATGTNHLAAQLRVWLACAELAGKQRAKAVLTRACTGLVLAWFAAGVLYALGVLWWAWIPAWIAAALVSSYSVTTPAAPKAAAKAPRPTRAAARERADLLAVLADILTDRSGIHLLGLFDRMREWPAYAEQDDRQLRALLGTHGVPVHRSVTADKVSGRSGIKRTDIEALLTPPPLPDSGTEQGESRADLQESRSLPATAQTPEGDTWGVQEPVTGLDDHVNDALDMLRGASR